MKITTVNKIGNGEETKTKKKVRSTKRTLFTKKLRTNFLDYIKFYSIYYDLYEKDIAKFLNLTGTTFSRIKTVAKSSSDEVTMSKWIIDILTEHLGDWTMKEEIRNLKKDVIDGRIAIKELSTKGAKLINEVKLEDLSDSKIDTKPKTSAKVTDYSNVKLVGVGETTKDIEVFDVNSVEVLSDNTSNDVDIPNSVMAVKHLGNISRDIGFIPEDKLQSTAIIIKSILKTDLSGLTQLVMFSNLLLNSAELEEIKKENKKLARALYRYDAGLETLIDKFKRDKAFDRENDELIGKYVK